MGASSPPKGPPVRYGHGYTDMRNVYGEMQHDAEGMRNVYQPPPEPRIVLPGEIWRYIDEDNQ